MTTTTDIGIFDAKTRLSELLRRTQTGESFRITQRGVPVAELVPIGLSKRMNDQEDSAKLWEFMKQQPKITDLNIKALVEEGQK
jgi:prevent-host-death family protein